MRRFVPKVIVLSLLLSFIVGIVGIAKPALGIITYWSNLVNKNPKNQKLIKNKEKPFSHPVFYYLDRYFSNDPITIKTDKYIEGKAGMVLAPGYYLAYGFPSDNSSLVLLAGSRVGPDGKVIGYVADLVDVEQLPDNLKDEINKLKVLTGWNGKMIELDSDSAIERAKKAIEYSIFERYTAGKIRVRLMDKEFVIDIKALVNGDADEKKKFSELMKNNNFYFYHMHGIVRNPNEITEEDIELMISALRIFLYHTTSNPEWRWLPVDYNNLSIFPPDEYEIDGTFSSLIGGIHFLGPAKIGDVMHYNVDISIGDGSKFSVYNPFDSIVNPRISDVIIWGASKDGEVNSTLIIRVTDPITQTEIPIEISHIDTRGSILENTDLGDGYQYTTTMNGKTIYVTVYSNLSIRLKPREYIGTTTVPLEKGGTDPLSKKEHIQFGVARYVFGNEFDTISSHPLFAFLTGYSLMYHGNIEKLGLDPWVIPNEGVPDGIYIDGNHVVNLVPYTLNKGTLHRIWREMQRERYFGTTANMRGDGPYAQLNGFERKFYRGRNPMAVLRNRRGPPKPKPYL